MNDFDFFTGTWDVANRWRADFLDEAGDWEEFPRSPAPRDISTGAASSTETTATKDSRSRHASSGRTTPTQQRAGNRHTHATRAEPGWTTGSWS